MSSTEPLTLDQAAEMLMAPEEPVEAAETEEVEAEATETEEVEVEESEDEVEYEASDDDDEEAEEAEAEESDDEEVQELRYTVKVDGKEKEVTLDELRRGYSGQQKIQLGMQQAAEARKAAQEAAQRATQYEQQLNAIYQQVQQKGIIAAPQAPSADLARTDPLGYIEAQATYNDQVKAYEAQQYQLAQAAQMRQQQQAQERKATLQKEAELARQRIPELADAKRAPDYKKKLVEFGQNELGYSLEDLSSVTDHRALYAMHLARIGYEAMQGKSKAQAKAKPAKPVVKAGAKKASNPKRKVQQQQLSKFKKSGDINDIVSLMFEE